MKAEGRRMKGRQKLDGRAFILHPSSFQKALPLQTPAALML
jgi:hypothetical protein